MTTQQKLVLIREQLESLDCDVPADGHLRTLVQLVLDLVGVVESEHDSLRATAEGLSQYRNL